MRRASLVPMAVQARPVTMPSAPKREPILTHRRWAAWSLAGRRLLDGRPPPSPRRGRTEIAQGEALGNVWHQIRQP